MLLTLSLLKTPAEDNPKNTSASLIASFKFLAFVFDAKNCFHLLSPFLFLFITPLLSNINILDFFTPDLRSKFVHAIADAPAPLTTIFAFFLSFF